MRKSYIMNGLCYKLNIMSYHQGTNGIIGRGAKAISRIEDTTK